MRFHSIAESISKRELSALAIVECFVSTAIYIGIGAYFGTFIHFMFAVALGPLFLLRTKYSYDTALTVWQKTWDKMRGIDSALIGLLLLPFCFLSGIAIRFAATVMGVFTHPYHSIMNIPDNWIRQAICTDLFYPPEVVPGESEDRPVPSFSRFIRIFREVLAEARDKPILTALIGFPLHMLIMLFGYLPAIVFRVSFKATSLFYLPLIWVVTTTVGSHASLKLRLERITKGELEKFRRRLSALVLTVAASRFALSAGLVEKGYVENLLGSATLATKLLDAWPWWHFLLIFDAAVTFVIFLAADALLGRLESGALPDTRNAEMAMKMMTFVRGFTAALTVLYFVACAITTVSAHLMLRAPISPLA